MEFGDNGDTFAGLLQFSGSRRACQT